MLAAQQVPADRWVEVLPHVQLALNNALSSSTGKAPSELAFGERLQLPVDYAVASQAGELGAGEVAGRIATWVDAAKKHIAAANRYAALQANRKRRDL